MNQVVTLDGNTVKIVRTETFEVNSWHKLILKDLLEDGYVELRGAKYTDNIDMPKIEAEQAFYDLSKMGVLTEIEDAWCTSGSLVEEKKNLINEILGA